MAAHGGQFSELNFHMWNTNWPMKREAKMAAHGGQFLDG